MAALEAAKRFPAFIAGDLLKPVVHEDQDTARAKLIAILQARYSR